MSESNNLPQSISHKKLSYLLNNAQKDKFFNNEDNQLDNSEKEIIDCINEWEILTKELIKKLSGRNLRYLKNRSSNAIKALGALEAHINMALHALNVFNNHDESC